MSFIRDDKKQKTISEMNTTVSTAILLAAGTGNRLSPLTDTLPKCLVSVNDVPIIQNALINLSECGITNTVIVIGHLKEKIREAIGNRFREMTITYVESDRYRSTNNIYSLWLARKYLVDDLLLLEADIYFEKEVITRMINHPNDNLMAVVKCQPWRSGTVVSTNEFNRVDSIVESRYQDPTFNYSQYYKTANIYRLNRGFLSELFLPLLETTVESGDVNSYYESILSKLCAQKKLNMNIIHCDDLKCIEIDSEHDLLKARYLFTDKEQQYEYISGLFGDYWRYDFKDYNLLYNLFFPPESLMNDISENLTNIMLNYPSGQDKIAELAGALINQPKDRIVVGNGASEIIKVICQNIGHKFTVPVPSFNEWVNAAPAGFVYESPIDAPSFELNIKKLLYDTIQFNSDTVIVVNPNNPTSLVASKSDLLWFAGQLAKRDIILVVDESFIDFADDNANLSMANEIDRFQNLVILKSMSKCYGIGGLRLGYVLSNNMQFVQQVRERIPIWNINGFAEAFLRLAPRYQKEFSTSCDMIREVRDDLYVRLQEINGLTVYKPSANFVFCKLTNNLSGPEITKQLFVKDNILIKHCGGKNMPMGDSYLRIACRDKEDNRIMVRAIKKLTNTFNDSN